MLSYKINDKLTINQYQINIKSISNGKNDFDEVFKNLATDLKIILLYYQNNDVEMPLEQSQIDC